MMSVSATATDTARRIWASASTEADTSEAMLAAADRVSAALGAELVRWIGRDGYHSLLVRALEEVRPEHRWLVTLSPKSDLPARVADGAAGRAPREVAEGMIALIAMVVHVLGRIAGEEIALRLVEQSWFAAAPATSPDHSAGHAPGTSAETK